MNLTFLGTSHGVPAADRFCSSYMLEAEDNIYIIDTGAPVADLLIRKGKDMKNIKAIFNTHFHGDHCVGMIHLLDLCSWYFKDAEFTTFVCEERSAKAVTEVIEATSTVFAKDRLKFNIYSEGLIFDDGVIKVWAIPTMHTSYNPVIASHAFYIEAGDKKLLFTGDLSMKLEHDDFPSVAFDRHMDIIVTECVHFEPCMLEKYMPKLDADILAVTHLNPEYIPSLEQMGENYDFTMLIAEDDDEIEF